MRLRKIKNAKEKLNKFAHIIEFSPSENKGKWNKVFPNDNPIYLEIGMGKGKFISEHALKNPDINYIGCEISESIMLKAARSIDELDQSNLKLINIDASILKDIFDEREVSRIYLNFSDPWPKSRHEKRRLTSDVFLDSYFSVLTKPAVIEMKTDNRPLFEYSLVQFNKHNFKFNKLSLDLHNPNNFDDISISNEIITTEYEEKFKSLGNVIYYIEVEK